MSEEKNKVIVDFREHPEIEARMQAFKASQLHEKERMAFMLKKLEQETKAAQERKDAFWNSLLDDLQKMGMLSREHERETDGTMYWEEEYRLLVLKPKSKQGGLEAIIKGIFT